MANPNVVDLNPEELTLVHDLASLVYVQDENLECWYTLQAAVVPHTDLYSTGVPGHKLSVHESRTLICPFLLERSEGVNMVVLAFKHRGECHYYYGVPVDKLAAWKPPTPPAGIEEETLLFTVKTSSSSVKFATVLENTASAKLKDNTVTILAGLRMFKGVGLTSPDKIIKWVQKTPFVTVVKKVLLEAESRERKLAAEKGRSANEKDREINRGLAAVATRAWEDVKQKLLLHAPFYSAAFSERFFIFESSSALEACLKDLDKHPLQEWLVPALKEHAAALISGRVQPAAPATPLKKLLNPPLPKPEVPGGAAAEGGGEEEDGADDVDPTDNPEAAATAAASTTTAAAAAAAASLASLASAAAAAAAAATTTGAAPSATTGAAQGRPTRPPRAAAATEAAPAKAAPPPKPTGVKPKATGKRDRDQVPLPSQGRQKLIPDQGASPNSNPHPDPDPDTV